MTTDEIPSTWQAGITLNGVPVVSVTEATQAIRIFVSNAAPAEYVDNGVFLVALDKASEAALEEDGFIVLLAEPEGVEITVELP